MSRTLAPGPDNSPGGWETPVKSPVVPTSTSGSTPGSRPGTGELVGSPVSTEQVLRSGRSRLTESGAEPATAGHDVRYLLAHLLDRRPAELLLVDSVPGATADRLGELVRRRAEGIPLQHLTGVAHFRRLALSVGPGVFVPRPETEVMTGWAIDRLRDLLAGATAGAAAGTAADETAAGDADRSPVVVDLCSGSGAVAAAIADEAPGARQYAVELSEQASDYARINLAGFSVELRVEDIADALPELTGQVDLVTANPPYIPLEAWESVTAEVRDHDPELALFSGVDGLDAIGVVATTAARLLRPGGRFCCEHAEVQEASAPAVFARTGAFTQLRDHRDLNDRPRFVTGRRI